MKELRFPVEAVPIMLFRRAVGSRHSHLSPDPDTSVAPPTFTESVQHFIPDYPMRPVVGQTWIGSGEGESPVEPSMTGSVVLHAEQQYLTPQHPAQDGRRGAQLA